MRHFWHLSTRYTLALLVALVMLPALASAQSLPPNVFQGLDGKLYPAAGYQWVTTVPGDFRVARIGAPVLAPAAAAPAPDKQAVVKALAKVLSAWVAHETSKPQDGDGVVELLLRETAKAGRDELLDSALTDVFPTAPAHSRRAMTRMIVLGMERRGGNQAVTRQQVMNDLRQTSPELADSIEIADFIVKAVQAN